MVKKEKIIIYPIFSILICVLFILGFSYMYWANWVKCVGWDEEITCIGNLGFDSHYCEVPCSYEDGIVHLIFYVISIAVIVVIAIVWILFSIKIIKVEVV